MRKEEDDVFLNFLCKIVWKWVCLFALSQTKQEKDSFVLCDERTLSKGVHQC